MKRAREVLVTVALSVLAGCSAATVDSAWGEPAGPPSAKPASPAIYGAPPTAAPAAAAIAMPVSSDALVETSSTITRITSCLDESSVRGSVWKTETCISRDGRYVAFVAEIQTGFLGRNRVERLVVYDVEAAEPHSLQLEHGGRNLLPLRREFELSADGRWIAFMVNENYRGDPASTQIFVSDWRAGTVEPIDVRGPGIDPDAGPVAMDFSDDMSRVVVFYRTKTWSVANCLVIDRTRDEAYVLAPPEGGAAMEPSISGDGRLIAFVNNLAPDRQFDEPRGLWIHEVGSRSYELLPLERWVDDDAADCLRQFGSPRVSRSGRFVTLLGSRAGPTLIPRAVLMVDRVAERVSAISRNRDGVPSDSPCHGAIPVEVGESALFVSSADLAGDDQNTHFDIFRYAWGAGRLDCVSMNSAGRTGDAWSFEGDIAEDGRSIVFWSQASNLVADDRNKQPDIFLWRR